MGFNFNLVEEPWLPCLTVEGETRQASLRDTLAEAHRLREVLHPSPLVMASLHRLLLAVVHRAFGPGDPASWQELWQAGAFPRPPLEAYLTAWRHRFGLFDGERPFYQVADLPGRPRPAQTMLHELASGNNATLFDHTVDRAALVLGPGQAACYLVALQSYAMSGTQTRLTGDPPGAEAAPLTKAALALLRGDTLFATLLLNWYRRTEAGRGHAREDRPAWERDPYTSSGARMPNGYADLLTWQSRRIRLFPEVADGQTVVRSALVMRGESFPPGFREDEQERMVAYRKVEKAKAGQKPWLPYGLDPGRAMWRDSTVFLVRSPRKTTISRPPWTIEWVAELVEDGVLDPGFTPPLELIGMASHQAKVLLWRRERMPLPLRYLANGQLVQKLQEALDRAEAVGSHLRQSLQRLEAELVRPLRDRTPRPEELASVRGLEERGRGIYWSDLEWEFKLLLTTLPADRREEDGAGRSGLTAVSRWHKAVSRAAQNAFEEQTSGLELSRRALRAVAVAQRELTSRLSRELKIEEVHGASPPT